MYARVLVVIVAMSAFGWAEEKKAAPLQVPKEAEQVSPGIFRHVDASGKAWIYRKTPFGLSKYEETRSEKPVKQADKTNPASASTPTPFGDVRPAKSAESGGDIKAVEDGEIVRFERASPFGVYKWTRKKSELTADEQAILERSAARSSGKAGVKE
jgi:hypothetical protein